MLPSFRSFHFPSHFRPNPFIHARFVHQSYPKSDKASFRHCEIPTEMRTPSAPSLNPHVYQLPANNEEVSRLNNQHILLKMLIGGKYFAPLKNHLAPQAGRRKTILDLGCGSGAWALDMATEFPHCSVIGVDIAPMVVSTTAPNLRIDVYDMNKGLHIYKNNQFDLVNGRMIAMGITNYSSLIEGIPRILKTGGFLQLQEWDFFAVDGEKRPIGSERWFGRWCAALRSSLAVRNASVGAAGGLDDMIRNEGSLQISHQQDVWMPVGPCFSSDTAEGRHLNLVGELMRENVKAFIKGGEKLILGNGMDPQEYQTISTNAIKEVQHADVPIYLRLNNVVAQKN